MPETPPTYGPLHEHVSEAIRAVESSPAAEGDGHAIHLHVGPAPQPRAPQVPQSSDLAQFISGVPPPGSSITHAELDQQLSWLEQAVFGALSTGAAGTGTDDVFMTPQSYRAANQLPDDAPVGPAIAAGAALGRHVPFRELLRVNPNALGEGMEALQVAALLTGFGGVEVKSIAFAEVTDDTPVAAVEQLQQHLEQHGHDAAVLLYRVDPLPDDAPHEERFHQVAIYREGNQWMLHDGTLNGGLPWGTTLHAVVQATFAGNIEAAGQLEVLSFTRTSAAAADGDTTLPSALKPIGSESAGGAGVPGVADGSGPAPTSLQLGKKFTAGVRTQFGTYLINNGFCSDLPKGNGSRNTTDWWRVASDLVASCRGTTPSIVNDQVVEYRGVTAPNNWLLDEARRGTSWTIRLVHAAGQVTEVKLSDLKRPQTAPQAVPPVGDHVLDPDAGSKVQCQTLANCLRQFGPDFQQGLPQQEGAREHVDLAGSIRAILNACSNACQVPRHVATDRQRRHIFEYTDLPVAGESVTVQVRFSDVAKGKVWDLLIYPSSREVPPPFAWKD